MIWFFWIFLPVFSFIIKIQQLLYDLEIIDDLINFAFINELMFFILSKIIGNI